MSDSGGTDKQGTYPEAVEGRFGTPHPNANVSLYEGPVTVLIGDTPFVQDGQAFLSWLPDSHIELVLPDSRLIMVEPNDSVPILIPGTIGQHRLLVTEWAENSQQQLSFKVSGEIGGCVERGN